MGPSSSSAESSFVLRLYGYYRLYPCLTLAVSPVSPLVPLAVDVLKRSAGDDSAGCVPEWLVNDLRVGASDVGVLVGLVGLERKATTSATTTWAVALYVSLVCGRGERLRRGYCVLLVT